jgi:6-phosphogluconolactonase (cycloisomerase 2 family)
MSVTKEGKLVLRPESYTANTQDKLDRVPTMSVVSPNGKFLLVGTTFDVAPILVGANPDGTPILWIKDKYGKPMVIASNAPDPDGLVVFPIQDDGVLGKASFQDAGGASPFFIVFLHNRPDTFVIGYAVGDGVSVGRLDDDGHIGMDTIVGIDTSAGKPAELCWLSVSPDDRAVFATNFGYSNISTFHLNGAGLTVAKDPACPKVPGDGTFRALCGDVSSGPSDNWVTPDGAYVYQIYGNASKLVGYATSPDGSLREVTSVKIPYNSPQGLAGF